MRKNRFPARRFRRFKFEQGAFARDAPGITGEGAAFPDDAMAGNDPADGVASRRGSNGTSVPGRSTDPLREFAISDRLAEGNGGNCVPDERLKGRSAGIERKIEAFPLTRGILLELPRGLGENVGVIPPDPAGNGPRVRLIRESETA